MKLPRIKVYWIPREPSGAPKLTFRNLKGILVKVYYHGMIIKFCTRMTRDIFFYGSCISNNVGFSTSLFILADHFFTSLRAECWHNALAVFCTDVLNNHFVSQFESYDVYKPLYYLKSWCRYRIDSLGGEVCHLKNCEHDNATLP